MFRKILLKYSGKTTILVDIFWVVSVLPIY